MDDAQKYKIRAFAKKGLLAKCFFIGQAQTACCLTGPVATEKTPTSEIASMSVYGFCYIKKKTRNNKG